MKLIQFEIPGQVQPKGRPRFAKNGVYSPKTTVKYEKFVAQNAALAMRDKNILTGYISVSLQIMETTPPSFSKLRKQRCLAGDFFPTRCDVDNCIKSVTDGMNGIVYADDRKIVHIEALRSYGEMEKCSVVVREIENIREIAR